MADWPILLDRPETMHIGSPQCDVANLSIQSASASAVWSSANRAIYIPFTLQRVRIVRKLFCVNGATASGNLDIGIYDMSLARLVSAGSTAQSGTSAPQIVDVTDTTLPPGNYYLALALDNTTGTIFRNVIAAASVGRLLGMAMQASAFPLPSTATPVALGTGVIPMCGIIRGRML